MEMSGLGVELHPNGGQADEEVDEVMGTVSEPGERLRSWIRPFGFVVLAMAMATQAMMTSWISASVPRKSNHCELEVFKDMNLSGGFFDQVCAWLLVGVNVVAILIAAVCLVQNTLRRSSRPSFDWYSAFVLSIVLTLGCSTAYQWKRVNQDFDRQPAAALLFWSFLNVCFLGAQGAFLAYLSSTAAKNGQTGLPCTVWTLVSFSLATLLFQFCLISSPPSASILWCRLGSQVLTTLAEFVAYRHVYQRIQNAGSPSAFTIFDRKALSGLAMLMFINFSEWMEQFILIIRIRGIWPELYEVDVEIAVLLAVINTSVPLLYIVVQTPNWSCRKSSLQIMLGKSMPWFCHVLLWIFFVIYLVWGCHMTCFPLHLDKANDGGWFFVLAKTSAATFYLDIPILFIVLLEGAFSLTLTTMGFSVPRDDAVRVHKCVGFRLIVMALVHGAAHVLWIGKDGLAE